MKVVKEPEKPSWTLKVTCTKRKGGCGARLLIEEKDLRVGCKDGYDYLGDANGPEGVCFSCPRCKTTHFVNAPAQVKSRVLIR